MAWRYLMIVDLLVWLGVATAAFVAWTLYASAGAPSSSDDREPQPGHDD